MDIMPLGTRKGWKLVWLRGASGMARRTSGGEEVVAVAGHRSRTLMQPSQYYESNDSWESHRLFSLEFVGAGRELGFGEPWEVMVVLTWLGLWARYEQLRR